MGNFVFLKNQIKFAENFQFSLEMIQLHCLRF